MTNDMLCYYVQYRMPHFGVYEPDKDILQVHILPYSEAVRIKENGMLISGEPTMYYIVPMGKYVDLPLIFETLPEDFRTPEEFWDQKKYW